MRSGCPSASSADSNWQVRFPTSEGTSSGCNSRCRFRPTLALRGPLATPAGLDLGPRGRSVALRQEPHSQPTMLRGKYLTSSGGEKKRLGTTARRRVASGGPGVAA